MLMLHTNAYTTCLTLHVNTKLHSIPQTPHAALHFMLTALPERSYNATLLSGFMLDECFPSHLRWHTRPVNMISQDSQWHCV